jgi:hypothetical protein
MTTFTIQVFQRRIDGDVNFYRTFPEYEDGFGTPDDEFWLGKLFLTFAEGCSVCNLYCTISQKQSLK